MSLRIDGGTIAAGDIASRKIMRRAAADNCGKARIARFNGATRLLSGCGLPSWGEGRKG